MSVCLTSFSLSPSLRLSVSFSLSHTHTHTHSNRYDCSDVERLSAEQNCEVVIAADEYYKKCVSEPPGSQASWNARDQHMTTTLLRIQAHLGDPKVRLYTTFFKFSGTMVATYFTLMYYYLYHGSDIFHTDVLLLEYL